MSVSEYSRHHSAHRRRPDVPRGAVPASDGILLVDKSQGLTSHDVVGATRRLAATRKVGHAGTLDPMATGLLLLGIGRATRFLAYLVGADKTYAATIRLGLETTTEDAEGEVTAVHGCRIDDLSGDHLQKALAGLTGQIQQVPSAVSAIKVDGVRAYKRVRDGQDVELSARPVTIHELRLTGEPRKTITDGARSDVSDAVEAVDIDILVSCSSGTYVRALARDLGRALGCGAHLTALRRTAVGPFDVDEARTLLTRRVQRPRRLGCVGQRVGRAHDEVLDDVHLLTITHRGEERVGLDALQDDRADASHLRRGHRRARGLLVRSVRYR